MLRVRRPPSSSGNARREADRKDGNPWGSMPSDALPAAAITARSLGEISPMAKALGWTLTVIDCFVLVYWASTTSSTSSPASFSLS